MFYFTSENYANTQVVLTIAELANIQNEFYSLIQILDLRELNMERDIMQFHELIGTEFEVKKNLVRSLIGDANWGEDGKHKEVVLRNILRMVLPETLRIGEGFVIYSSSNKEKCSKQIDILITDSDKPVLFKEGDMILATPHSVNSVIEVKTKIATLKCLEKTIEELAKEAFIIRSDFNRTCKFGLFVYENSLIKKDKEILELLRNININKCKSNDKNKGVIDWLVLGPDRFFELQYHYFPPQPFGWNLYNFSKNKKANLAFSYFIIMCALDYVIFKLENYEDIKEEIKNIWFPIDGGLEAYKTGSIGLSAEPNY